MPPVADVYKRQDISNLKSNIKLAKLIIEKSYFPDENKIEDNWLWASPTIEKL